MFLLCLIDFFSKYAWVVPLKGKKEVTLNAFPKILDNSVEVLMILVLIIMLLQLMIS